MANKQPTKEELLILVASLYYVENLGQAKVAQLAGISQANVSRLLSEARKRNIVQISVKPFSPRDHDLEKQLKKSFNLNHVIVINSSARRNLVQQRQAIGYFSAPDISSLIKSRHTVCVAAGRHIQSLVENMQPGAPATNVIFVQAMGHISNNVQGDDAFEITRKLAKKWNGTSCSIQAPAITADIATFNAFTSHNQIRSVLNYMDKVDLAIVGVGISSDSVFLDRAFIAPSDMKALTAKGVVGEICGHFYDNQGTEVNTSYKDLVIGISLQQLRDTSDVLAVVSNANRAPAVQA
ncbi:MAG: sugar-binding domain-containing protein, partial [Candidatus Marinimicrobia bacterium]|nr:sugar-binding domain-containing protein [Candidatus Neomarinimicrobiota bacterium]